ncbi:MAG TPA: class I SAM-dependent methyltransferase [Acidobacteriota bacterium]
MESAAQAARDYQRDYSRHFPGVLDEAYKTEQGRRLSAVLAEAGPFPAGAVALDLGCSGGFSTRELAARFAKVIGFDLDPHAVRFAQRQLPPQVLMLVADGLRLPLRPASVAAILCSQIYEHVPDPERLMREMERALAPGGVICFGATNKWIVIEPHYRLPFLSWLPRRWADAYVRRARGLDRYYERLKSRRQLRRLCAGFEIEDFTLRMVRDPERYHCRDLVGPFAAIARAPLWLLRLLLPLFPSYVWILRQPRPPS